MCKTQALADIVILVDGSWSIGRINFRLVRTFLESLVRAFDVDFDRTRIGELGVRFGWEFQRKKSHNVRVFVCRPGSVQRRPQDRVAPQHPHHQGGCDGRCQDPAVQRRKHTDRYALPPAPHFPTARANVLNVDHG